MTWEPLGKDGRQISTDWHYMTTRNSRGEYEAWQRQPNFKRLGRFTDREQARTACETQGAV